MLVCKGMLLKNGGASGQCQFSGLEKPDCAHQHFVLRHEVSIQYQDIRRAGSFDGRVDIAGLRVRIVAARDIVDAARAAIVALPVTATVVKHMDE
jgi:hypothetical protein